MLVEAGVGMGEAGEGGSGAVVGGVRGRVSRGEWGGVARPRVCRVSRGAGGGVAGHRGVRCRVSRGVGGRGLYFVSLFSIPPSTIIAKILFHRE